MMQEVAEMESKPCGAVRRMIDNVLVGEPVSHGALWCVPLLSDSVDGPAYTTLGEAIANGALTVSEVDDGGSVAELLVTNSGECMVLLLDGEELAGAKQNRCLNASVLLAAHSTTIVPVSCTEHGRWSPHADMTPFRDSGNIMAHQTRVQKTAGVHYALCAGETWASRESQRAVWNGVDELASRSKAFSPTAAMSDIFASRQSWLESTVDALTVSQKQVGSVFGAGPKVLGLDLVSCPAAYARLHRKLVRSHAIEAFLEADRKPASPREAAYAFLRDLKSCRDEPHRSVGCGIDHRLSSSAAIGSALVYRNRVIHMVFLALD